MKRLFFPALFVVLTATRLCHVNVLWAEEGLPLAAAVQMLGGRTLYRDIWFDKPPLVSAVYLLWGAQTGWPLRLVGAAFALAVCLLAWQFARRMWGEREGYWAAGLMGFFLTFDVPSAVLPLAADMLMLAPHLAAVYLAWRGRPFAAGAAAGVAFLCNAKGLIVLGACVIWSFSSLPLLVLGFLAPNAVALAWLAATGSTAAAYEQVWWLGNLYAKHTFLEDPVPVGLSRTLNWFGFHTALACGAAWFWLRDKQGDRRRMAAWAALSLMAVAAGWRFFPRYYFQLLPVMVLLGARGAVLMGKKRVLLVLTLLVPLIRFGPRYAELAAGRSGDWADIAMDQDSRAASRLLTARARPGDTLFVWGYRPDLYAYTRLPAASRFLECQPLTGVFADRHLFSIDAVSPGWAKRNRAELVRTRPQFLVDGLGAYNPALAIGSYPSLQDWLKDYELVDQTGFTRIYRRRSGI
jgi:hypothetical protein